MSGRRVHFEEVAAAAREGEEKMRLTRGGEREIEQGRNWLND